MVQFNIRGVSENVQDTSTAGYIRAAATSDLSSIIVFDRTAGKPVEIKTEVLPQNLQTDLSGCDTTDCKYVSYNFQRQVVTEPRSTSNLNHILDLGPIVQVDSGVFLKETAKLPVIFSSLPAYDLKYTSYTGTALEVWNNIKGPQVCADRCDTLGASCEGFNFNQLTFDCSIFGPGSPKDYDGSLQSFTKADIKTTVVPHVYGTTYDFNPAGAGDKCRDADACNRVLSNLVSDHILNKFTTKSIKECQYCPVRGFYRISGDRAILTNEYLNSMQVNDIYNTLFYMQYNKTVVQQTGCQPGTHRTAVGGQCVPCGLTLPPNSAYRYQCEYTTCAANQSLTSIWGAGASLSRPYFVNYCTDSAGPYGHHEVDVNYSWSLTVGGVVYPQTFSKKETLPCAWGLTTELDTVRPPPAGYKYNSGACTYSSCNGLKWDSSQKIETQIAANEIYVVDTPITRRAYVNDWGHPGNNVLSRVEYPGDTGAPGTDWTKVDWYSNQNYRVYNDQVDIRGCNASRCPINSISNADHTQCVPCANTPGTRDRRRYATSCEICSVPIGSTWATPYDRILNGVQVSPTNPSDQCNTIACTTLPTGNQIWNSDSLDMCGVRECAVDQVPNADRTACVNAPGVSSICQVHDCAAKCTTGSTISADGKSCTPCSPVGPGYDFAYGAANACYAPRCTNTPLNSNIYDVGCTERICFASTGPNADRTACVDCGTEPYNDNNGTRYGYISNVTGGGIFGSLDNADIGGNMLAPGCVPLGICPVPTGLRRWRYGVGCDHVICPRAPGTNERWASTFGCDIVTYTGSTVCSVYPTAGNTWTNTTTCGITACPTMTTPRTCAQMGYSDADATQCYMLRPATGCPAGSREVVYPPNPSIGYPGYTFCYIDKEQPVSLFDPYEIWGPGCTRISKWERKYQDRINASKTYPLKCPNFPRPGQQYDGITPCNVVNCTLTPATGYIWDVSDSFKRENGCATKLCTGYTFPNADRTKCIPCPVSAAGWYQTGTLCRVDACSNRTTLVNNQYWTDQYCSYSTCPAGFRIVNAYRVGAGGPYNLLTCGQCNATPTSQQYWASPGASCDIVTCQGQTKVNAARNACEPCTQMTPAYGYTFSGVNGCTPVQCPAIGSSNIWVSAGSCDSTACIGSTRPNAARTACETCPTPAYGLQWASTAGCATTACPAIATSNIFTTAGSCDNTACLGHTQPNANKSSCVACSLPAYGRYWASVNGCATTACPAIASSNIWTEAGSCNSRMCVGLTQPDASKTMCEKCPTPAYGRQWASNNGCATTACPAIASSNIFPVAGYCFDRECTDNTQPNADKSVCVACPAPSPGYEYVSSSGCSTRACTQTAAPGYFWDPNGGCTLIQCTNVPGPNQYFTSGCSVQTCQTGTLRNPDGFSCGQVCDPTGVTLPTNSIYVSSSTGACTTTQCTGHTRPDASTMVCEACPTPAYGLQWASASGCATTACSAIASNSIFTTAGSCASTACTGLTIPNIDKSACVPCSGHTQPNATNSACVACTAPSLGYRWASTDGCDINACPDIPSDSIFTTAGDCNLYTKCTGHTQPNATKSACVACPYFFGNTWTSVDGCALTACPPIISGNIFATVNSCAGTACTGSTQPNAAKTVCEACPTPPLGRKFVYNANSSGWLVQAPNCVMEDCPAIDTNEIYLPGLFWANARYCNSTACIGTTVPNEDKTACVDCMDHTTPNVNTPGMLDNTMCVDCPLPSLGNTWSVDTGCATMSCDAFSNGDPFLYDNEIYTPEGFCAYRACTGRTRPDVTKTVCEDCPPITLAYGWTFVGAPDGCDPVPCQVASSNIFLSAGFCESVACTGHTQPNGDRSACVACSPVYGRYWTSTDGCATTACPSIPTSNIWVSAGSCESTACTGHTTRNSAKTACVACATPIFGYTWALASGCSTMACPAIASSNIFTTAGLCDNTACTGHTQPNATKGACDPCTISYGYTWASTDGCAITACPAISSSNIFTMLGSCASTACTGRTQPNATMSACDACPTLVLGNVWSSTDGCAITACSISSSNIFTTLGSCANVACGAHQIPNSTKSACVPNIVSGDVLWVARVGGAGGDGATSITTNTSAVYITGYYNSNPVTAYHSNGVAYSTTLALNQTSSVNTFIVKYDTSGTVQWLTRIATSTYDGENVSPSSIASDTSGIYVAGTTDYGSSTLTLYNSDGTAYSRKLNMLFDTTNDAFIIKYNTSGFVQWATRLSGQMGNQTANCIIVNSSGVYVTGWYTSAPFKLYNGDGSLYATSFSSTMGESSAYIVKYNTSGFIQWATRVSSPGNTVAGRKIATDSAGVYVVGDYMYGPITFYHSNAVAYATTLPTTGGLTTDVFIGKYNTSGVVQWVARIAGTNNETSPCVATDSTGVYIVGGYLSNPLTIYHSNAVAYTTTLTNAGNKDVFVAKYNTSGVVQWVARIAGTSVDTATTVTTDSTGVYISGYYTSSPLTAYHSNAVAYTTTLTNSGKNGFIVKYDTSGNVQMVNRTGTLGGGELLGSASDTSGKYMTGYYTTNQLTTYYKDGSTYETVLPVPSSSDAFIVKYL